MIHSKINDINNFKSFGRLNIDKMKDIKKCWFNKQTHHLFMGMNILDIYQTLLLHYCQIDVI
jgi:hypothetical protein